MPETFLEQALYSRASGGEPHLYARSIGIDDGLQAEIDQLLRDFGEKPVGIPCPGAIFAQPLGKNLVAIVQLADKSANVGQPAVGFHVLVMSKVYYRQWHGDPFAVADHFPPPWQHAGPELPAPTLPSTASPQRTVAEVRSVLKRIKAGALRENEDPEAVELNAENAESPALLGGVQVLVDGGKLVFVRPAPDPGLIRGLWTLLPTAARCQLWPATFAFSNALGFDALVVPRRGDEDFSDYATEDQASDYPAGRYELSLQTAAESGDQAALDALFARRTTHETLRLGMVMVVVLGIAMFVLRASDPGLVPADPPVAQPVLSPLQREAVAINSAMVASGNPWSVIALHQAGRYRQAERFATAAAVVANTDPFAAAVQMRLATARYSEIWTSAR